MTDKELREIKRRFRPDRCNASCVKGAFINENKEIIYRINQPLGLTEQDTSAMLLGVMKKILSGNIGTGVSEIEFSTRQVEAGEEHKLLMRLRESSLKDNDALEAFYAKVAQTADIEGNFAVLLINDVYDVFKKSSDGEYSDSTEVFNYIACAICPVKTAPDSLSFREADSLFHTSGGASTLSSPELGFLFPAFDDRTTNIYGALYYSRSKSQQRGEFTSALFGCKAPMPPAIQKATFSDTLSSALKSECTLDVIKAVHAAVGDMVEHHKETRDPEPLTLSKNTVATVLESVGVDAQRVEDFGKEMDAGFGIGANLAPKNLIAYNKFELKMPEIKINVSPEYRDNITTREIGGEQYILIKLTGPAEVNGIPVNLSSPDTKEEE